METNFLEKYCGGEELDTPSKILVTALIEFADAPVKSVGTRDIARRAGVNIAAISYYFKGKDGLYAELITQIIDYFEGLVKVYFDRHEALMLNPSKPEAAALLKDYISWRVRSPKRGNGIHKYIFSILIREEINKTPLFMQVYSRLIKKNDALSRDCVKMVMGDKIGDEAAGTMGVIMLGTMMRLDLVPDSFALSMGWQSIGAEESEKILAAMLEMLDKVLA